MVAHLCLLFHMHQPSYVDPTTGRAELPWTRLHGARAYLDVALALEAHPGVHLTVNFVPSLVAQLEAVVAGARDAWLETAEKPTGSWTPEERILIVQRGFSVSWERGIDPRPRYRELLERRGRAARREELPERARAFSDGDLRDLTVLFNLAWIGFAARRDDPELAALEKKGRGYDDQDFALVIARQRAACARVLPLWRRLQGRGQVELSASPYYHPIVPLLVDTEAARRARPELPLPERFAWPDDAEAQIARGLDAHARAFGARPAGMWPPEGSVSPEAVARYARAGVRWLATDEGNLWRSLEACGRPDAPRGDLYRAYRHQGVDLVFRDRELSDRIGFSYAHGEPAAGAADLLARAGECARASTAPAGDPPLVPIFLDGENPWEAYPGSGESFLHALFSGLERSPSLRAMSLGEHLEAAGARVELPSLHSGSWIDSDFHIWIGDPVKNRAWELLGRVRRRFERAREGGLDPARLERAFEHLLAAEGSDWFWWFGEPFHSAEDATFDRLFRAHLVGALAALGEPVPDELVRPVAGGALATPRALKAPSALIRPRIGARAPSFYDWHGAGLYEVPRGAAMAEEPLVERIRFGFDRATLYLRLEPSPGRAAELPGATLEVTIAAGARRLLLRMPLEAQPSWTILQADPAAPDGFRALGSGGPAAFGRAIELGVPFARLGLSPGAPAELAFRLMRGEAALGRWPAAGGIAFSVPDDAFEARNWWV